jgi:hypothetical protein
MKDATAVVLSLIVVAGMFGLIYPMQAQVHASSGQAASTTQIVSNTAAPRPSGLAAGIPACSLYEDQTAFANNASVTFNPYSNLAEINTDGSVPSGNIVSQYARTIDVIVTPMKNAVFDNVFLTVWGTGWNNQTLTSTLPTAPGIWPLFINHTTGIATGMLNDMKYFPPGATVYFNITVYSTLSGNAAVYSPCPDSSKMPTWGNNTFPTWAYTVGGGWSSPTFTSDIKITAFPNVFAGIFPSIYQPVSLTITSISGIVIGGANVNYTRDVRNISTGGVTVFPGGGSEYANGFSPANSTTLTSYIGPFNFSKYDISTINFHIRAWTLWSGGAVNMIDSYFPSDIDYTYTITAGGTWCGLNQSWNQDVIMTTQPYANISQPDANVQIQAMTDIVNVSIESTQSNITIDYAFIFFNETYQGKNLPGELMMTAGNSTMQYTGTSTATGNGLLGPYLPGIHVSFYISATDGNRCTITSPTYSFYTALTGPRIIDNKTFFYVVAFDQGLGTYAIGAQVVIMTNGTVICQTATNALGFAYPNASASTLPLYLAMNENYNITVTYNGAVQTAIYFLTATSNKTLTFYFDTAASAPIIYAVSTPPITIPLIAGLVVATATVIPIYLLWSEMRKRAKEEEKRITL